MCNNHVVLVVLEVVRLNTVTNPVLEPRCVTFQYITWKTTKVCDGFKCVSNVLHLERVIIRLIASFFNFLSFC